jgi:hypothetical protein
MRLEGLDKFKISTSSGLDLATFRPQPTTLPRAPFPNKAAPKIKNICMTRNTKSVQGTHDQESGAHKGAQRRRNTKIGKEHTFSKY